MTSLDERWYPFIAAHSDIELDIFNDLTHITHENRQRFLEGVDDQPLFSALHKVKRFNVGRERNAWSHFLNEISAEKNETVRDLYQKKILRHLSRISLIEATYESNSNDFSAYTRELYGQPKSEYVSYIAHRLQTLIANAPSDIADEAGGYFEPFLSLNNEEKTFPLLFQEPVFDTEYVTSSEEVHEIFESYLAHLQLPGWNVMIDTTGFRKIFSVSLTEKRIYIPGNKFLMSRNLPLTKKGAEALAAHEIGVHAQRAEQGKRSALQLLGYGLHDYLRGEEGVATYMQQSIEGATEYYGFDRYLAIALAEGVDGSKRAFRDVFEGLRYYYLLLNDQNTVDDVFNYATNAAFSVTQRVFRGTNGQAPGVVYTRDLAYLEGNIGTWQLMTEKPDWRQYLTIGKYDMLNTEHVTALRDLEIIASKSG